MTTVDSRPGRARSVTERQDPAAAATATRTSAGPAVTVTRVVRAELLKLLTVRSTYYALLATFLAIAGIATFVAIGIVVGDIPPGGEATADPTGGALTGVSLAGYVVAAVGVLAVTSEYSTGTIRATLAAVPNRGILVLGKLVAVGSVTLVVALVSALAAFFAAKAVLSTDDMDISLSTPGVARAVIGAALYLTAVALFAGGLAWLLRSTAGALATLAAVLVVLPVAAYLLPAHLRDDVMPYLPDSAGMAILQTTTGPAQLAPWTGFAVFTAYTALTLIAGAVLLQRRDA